MMNVLKIPTTASTTYTFTGLSSGMNYLFTVSAYNSFGESPKSNVLNLTTLSTKSKELNANANDNNLFSDLGNIILYPSPVKDELNISGLSDFEDTIFDLTGKRVLSISKANGNIDVSGLSQGVYLIKINSAEDTVVKKFVKQ